MTFLFLEVRGMGGTLTQVGLPVSAGLIEGGPSFRQGAKEIFFTACHSGKLKLPSTSPDVISTSLKSFVTSRIDFTVLLLFEFLKKYHLPVGQVKNRIH